jgi:hypothetical protein
MNQYNLGYMIANLAQWIEEVICNGLYAHLGLGVYCRTLLLSVDENKLLVTIVIRMKDKIIKWLNVNKWDKTIF